MIYKTGLNFIALTTVVLTGCSSDIATDKKTSSNTPSISIRNDHSVTTGMYLIRDNLYLDETGNLFFRVLDVPLNSHPEVVQDFEGQQLIYKNRFGLYDKDHVSNLPKRLRDVIDAKSWHRLYDTLYIDKNNLYCYHYFTGGGWIAPMDGFDPEDMKALIIHNNGSWRISEIASREAMKVTQDERVWHFTDGVKVIDYRCDNQGPLDEWMFQ